MYAYDWLPYTFFYTSVVDVSLCESERKDFFDCEKERDVKSEISRHEYQATK